MDEWIGERERAYTKVEYGTEPRSAFQRQPDTQMQNYRIRDKDSRSLSNLDASPQKETMVVRSPWR